MGTWGEDIYENDTALDVKEMVEQVCNKIADDYEARKVIIDAIKEYYTDEDERLIAWLVAADQLIAGFNAREMYKMYLKGETITGIEIIEKEILEKRPSKKRKKRKVYYETYWRHGDIYIYDVSEKWRNDPAFKEKIFGFYCIDMYEYEGVYPIVYAFRLQCKPGDLYQKPELSLNGSFWRVANCGDRGYMYRIILYNRKRAEIPEERLHYCGNITKTPDIMDEYIPYDKLGNPIFYWTDIEERILYTRILQS